MCEEEQRLPLTHLPRACHEFKGTEAAALKAQETQGPLKQDTDV
jgi:hypothetical protein